LYDVMGWVHFLGRERRFREWTVRLAGVRPGDAVLDVGCGTGNLAMAAKARAGAEGDVRGIDGAPEMVEVARRKAAAAKLGVEYEVAVVENMPFADATFDIVLSSLMLHHLPGDLKRQGIAEIARVLKPGGRLVAVDLDLRVLKNLGIVEEAMKAEGFTEIHRGETPFRTLLIRIHYLAGTWRSA
jgi:demethylmenaquinone methyltransferase/2-methoxy-6-polyprenyl-1,4-benzoquinol methylase/phosphoethanolamine N-methyltransferase